MAIVGIVIGAILGLIVLYVIGVYLHNFIARRIAKKQPPLSPDEQRAADYAAYKAKM